MGEARNQTHRDELISIKIDMSFAGQRATSYRRRIVLNLEALLSYCHLVVRERGATPEEGHWRLALLASLPAESVILLGMMVDASDECMILSRLLHRDTF